MAIVSYKLAQGTLTLGTVPLDVSGQVTAMVVEASENVTSEDDIPVLSGELLEGVDEADYDYRLKGALLQDISAAGVVAWSWANRGTPQPFVFVPDDTSARQVTGNLRPIPLKVGGDVKARATSELDWAIIGTPDFGPVI